MRKGFAVLMLLAAVFVFSQAHAEKLVSVKKVPASIEEFITLRDAIANSPEGGATVFAIAMIVYSKDKNLGMQMFTVALDSTRLVTGTTYKGYTPDQDSVKQIVKLSDAKKFFIPYSYINGTRVDKSYEAVLPYTFVFDDSRMKLTSENEVKIFIVSSGDQLPRAVYLKRNDKKIWKISGFDEMMKDVAQPVLKKGDDL